jgi:hypothetical protein
MSSLIFYSDETQVLTATDTLATSAEVYGQPLLFTTKAFIVPHLQLIMCGIGCAGVLGKWFVEVNDRFIVRGIDDLNYHTPKALASIWAKFREKFSIPDNQKITIYHLGFSEEDGLMHNFVYRSTNNFLSENIIYGIYTKPFCHLPENAQFPMVIKSMMDEQREIQQSKPEDERIYIGGKILIHHLTNNGFSVYFLDQFDDFDKTQQSIFDNFNSRK